MIIRIKGYTFELREPFVDGAVISLAESQALNALRAENIRNNMTKVVERALAALREGEVLPVGALTELRAAIAKYDEAYTFPLRHRSRLSASEIDRFAREVAEERLAAQARQAGVTFTPQEWEAKIEEWSLLPAVQEEARRRVQEAHEVVKGSLADLMGAAAEGGGI